MFHVKRLCSLLLIAAVITLPGAAGQAAEHIGKVDKVRVYAYGTAPGLSRTPLYARDPLFQNEVIETVRDGALLAVFNDGSQLTIGSSTKMKLDRFVYAKGQGKDAMVLTMVRGALRFVTGKIDKPAFVLKTPQATIGIRGTDFIVQARNGGTVISVLEGSIFVTFSDGSTATLNAGQTARFGNRNLQILDIVIKPDDLFIRRWDQEYDTRGDGEDFSNY